jgi:hexulose-6-phosphate isomerase
MNRRDFVRTATTGLAGSLLYAHAGSIRTASAQPSTGSRFKTAVKLHMVDEDISLVDKFRMLQEIGYDGVESRTPDDAQLQELQDARAATGLPVHGLIHPDPELASGAADVRAAAVDRLTDALDKAHSLETTTVLLVPASMDENSSYVDIYHRSQDSIREALPAAREHGVKIALENVTNRFLYSPMEFARYIDELESPWVGSYFDTGNVIGFGYPQDWIRTLGDRIVKLDIKDRYWGDAGRELNLGEGDVNWSAVQEALAEIGFQGWTTAEVRGGDRQRLAQVYELMNQVLGI